MNIPNALFQFCLDEVKLKAKWKRLQGHQRLIPIEQVPLGARILTKNPRPWDYDDSLPEPDEDTWGKISLTMH